MQRTTAPGATSDQRFTDGDSSQGLPASVVDAKWLNDVQEEVAGAIEGYNVQLDSSKATQLLGVLQSISGAITTAKNQVTAAFQQSDSQLSAALTRNINDGDGALGRRIDGEATTRAGADNGLGNRIDDIISSKIPEAILAAKKALFPVGSIYCNYNDATNPSSLLGFGSWARISDGFLLSQNSYSGAAGATGGERTHTLDINEMPVHAHGLTGTTILGPADPHDDFINYQGGGGDTFYTKSSSSTANQGGGQAHNNMPPYVVVYMWRRTA
ncbi:MAG: hypothetical protein PF501_09835 [Salinisphaera sp.]|jgi:hypothetical protein|nr:hypothetical protein [Salinisphaera sp.]